MRSPTSIQIVLFSVLLSGLAWSEPPGSWNRDPFLKKPIQSAAPEPGYAAPTKRFFSVTSKSVSETLATLPRVTVTGIITVGAQNLAIVKSSDGTRIVSEGQSLASYRISKISSQAIVLKRDGTTFRLPLKSDFG